MWVYRILSHATASGAAWRVHFLNGGPATRDRGPPDEEPTS